MGKIQSSINSILGSVEQGVSMVDKNLVNKDLKMSDRARSVLQNKIDAITYNNSKRTKVIKMDVLEQEKPISGGNE